MSVISFDEVLDRTEPIAISTQEYAALTGLESHVRRVAAKRSPVDRRTLSMLLEQIRTARR